MPAHTPENEQLVSRLRLGDTATESILDAIERIAPSHPTIGEFSDAELDELLSSLENASVGSTFTSVSKKKANPKRKSQTDEEFFMSLDDDFVDGLVSALDATLKTSPQ